MPTEMMLALAGFAFVASITPGPNNIMLMTSGVNFGFLRTLPHMTGVAVGFDTMLLLVGFGIGQAIEARPVLGLALKVASVVYLLWLAYKIARAGPVGGGGEEGRPMTFLQAAAFQWVNPKAWAMALTASAAYVPADGYPIGLILMVLVFGMVNLPCIACWTGFGVTLRQMLRDPVRVRVFNVAMAALLVASLWPIATELWRLARP